jgi:integrase
VPIFTDPLLASAKPRADRYEIRDSKIVGLGFIVQPSGAKSFAVRYRVDGKSIKYTLKPSYPLLSLKEARKQAQAALGDAAKGQDPVTLKRAAKLAALAQQDTVASVAEAYLARPGHSSSWRYEATRLIRREILPVLGAMPVADLMKREARKQVRVLLRSIADRGSPILANRVLSLLKRLVSFAVEEELIDINPLSQLKAPSKENRRERVLSESELRLVWQAFENAGFPFGPIGKLLLLTGARRGEIADLSWREINFREAVWSLPATRAKNRQSCVIPLSDPTLAILSGLPRFEGSDYVFTSGGTSLKGAFSRSKRGLDAAITQANGGEAIPSWVLHDLRRTVATNLQRLGTPWEVIESALNHVGKVRGGISGIYQRHGFENEKRAALDAWATRLMQIIEGREPDESNVVALRAG